MIRLSRNPSPSMEVIERIELDRVRYAMVNEGKSLNAELLAKRYAVEKRALWEQQKRKCAYCESPQPEPDYRDVEHFRPKLDAIRSPGRSEAHGYWWLTWRWENLLFACNVCNRSWKKTQFPLEHGSGVLFPPDDPFAFPHRETETCLLIDPYVESGIEHIEFRLMRIPGEPEPKWTPIPRDGSKRGRYTIEVCGLDRSDMRDAYTEHVRAEVAPHVKSFRSVWNSNRVACETVLREAERKLFRPGAAYVALSYDALRAEIDDDELNELRIARRVPW